MPISNKSFRARTTARLQRHQKSEAQNTTGSAEAPSPGASRHNDGPQPVEDDHLPGRPAFMGPPPLIPGEDPKAYQDLCDALLRDVEPKDVWEITWAFEIADYIWDASRVRKHKNAIYNVGAPLAVEELLSRLQSDAEDFAVLSSDDRQSLSRLWARRDKDAQEEVRRMLRTAGWPEDTVASQTFIQNIETFERADRMIMAYQRHRNILKRRIERHREDKANRKAASDVQQADTEVAPDKKASSKGGAA